MAAPPSKTGSPGEPEALQQRWRLIRDLSVFVVKAAIETLRDLVLIPVAVAAGLLGLIFQRDHPARYFREVIEAGRRFDDWLNLFGAGDRTLAGGIVKRTTRTLSRRAGPAPGVDALLTRVEQVLVEEHRRGGVTAQAKEVIDRALDAIQGAPSRTTDEDRRP